MCFLRTLCFPSITFWSRLQLWPLGFSADLNTGVLGRVPGKLGLWMFWFMWSALYHTGVQWPFTKDGFSFLKHELVLLFFHFPTSFISCLPTSVMVKTRVLMTRINQKYIRPEICPSSAPSEPSTFKCLCYYKAGELEMKSEGMMCSSEMASHRKINTRKPPRILTILLCLDSSFSLFHITFEFPRYSLFKYLWVKTLNSNQRSSRWNWEVNGKYLWRISIVGGVAQSLISSDI